MWLRGVAVGAIWLLVPMAVVSAARAPDGGGAPQDVHSAEMASGHVRATARVTRPRAYYVSVRGSDASDAGSRRRPWRTLAHACAATPPGIGNTIRLEADTYSESVTCRLPCMTSLRGAGRTRTVVEGSADPLILVRNCARRGNSQSVSGLRLDGRDRTAGRRGMVVDRVRGLTISGLAIVNFRGPGEGHTGGGALNVTHAWHLDLGRSVLRNGGSVLSDECTGTLGLGDIHDSTIHDLTISEDRGYGVKGIAHSSFTNVDFDDLRVDAGSEDCSSWNTLAFELADVDVVGVQIRNSIFNRTISLLDPGRGSRLRSGHRCRIHNNVFDEGMGGNNYAIELDNNDTIVDHNYFDGGLYPIANFTDDRKTGNVVHHNVFDNQYLLTAAMHYTAGVQKARFYKNTVVLRQQSWRDGVFSFDERGFERSTIDIEKNIFVSTYPIGNKLGRGLASATIADNDFYNIDGSGASALTANPGLSLSGGFPEAYVPARGSPAAHLGAFADGPWSAGPRTDTRGVMRR